MVIEHIFEIVNLILNKNRRGFIRTSQKSSAVKAGMYDFFNSEIEVYRKTGIIPASLKKLTKPVTVIITDGVGNLPSDFAQEVTFSTEDSNHGIILTPEEFQDRLNSNFLDPDQKNPIIKIMHSKIYLQPDEYEEIELTYIRQPAVFVYATTIAGDNRSESFNSGASTDIEFGYEHALNIAYRALKYLGVAFQNAEALQLALNDNKE